MVFVIQPMNHSDSTHFTAWKTLKHPDSLEESVGCPSNLQALCYYEMDGGESCSSEYECLSDSEYEQQKMDFRKSRRMALDEEFRNMSELSLLDSDSLDFEDECDSLSETDTEQRRLAFKAWCQVSLDDIRCMTEMSLDTECESEKKAAVLKKFRALPVFRCEDSESFEFTEGEEVGSDKRPSLRRQNCVIVDFSEGQRETACKKMRALPVFGFECAESFEPTEGEVVCSEKKPSVTRQNCVVFDLSSQNKKKVAAVYKKLRALPVYGFECSETFESAEGEACSKDKKSLNRQNLVVDFSSQVKKEAVFKKLRALPVFGFESTESFESTEGKACSKDLVIDFSTPKDKKADVCKKLRALPLFAFECSDSESGGETCSEKRPSLNRQDGVFDLSSPKKQKKCQGKRPKLFRLGAMCDIHSLA